MTKVRYVSLMRDIFKKKAENQPFFLWNLIFLIAGRIVHPVIYPRTHTIFTSKDVVLCFFQPFLLAGFTRSVWRHPEAITSDLLSFYMGFLRQNCRTSIFWCDYSNRHFLRNSEGFSELLSFYMGFVRQLFPASKADRFLMWCLIAIMFSGSPNCVA